MASGFVRSTGCLAAALAIGALAGCGSSSPSSSGSEPAGQVMSHVRSQALAAKSVHISGSVKQGATTIGLDLSFDGSDFAGTVAENGKTITTLALGGVFYVKVTPEFLTITKLPAATTAAFCKKYCGRYIELPESSAPDLTGNASMKALVQQAFSAKIVSQAKQSSIKFVPATFNGQQVLQATQDGYTFDVTTGSAPYPILWAGKGQRVEFSDWNSVTLPPKPPAKDVVSLSSLEGGA
jgi:hypothetical protein